MSRPNVRLVRVGDELAHVLATLVTDAVEHIHRELTLDAPDSLPDHTPGAAAPTPLPYLERPPCRTCKGHGYVQGQPCDECDHSGKAKLTVVEKAAVRRYELTSRREDIRDLIASLESLTGSLRDECDRALRTRLPDKRTEKGQCYADPGLDGYMVPIGEGGWFDPSCTNISRTIKPGLCDAHRKAFDRYRERMGLKPVQDDREVKHDSTVHYVDGVALVREVA